ncbi:enoyl-CoA hydratase/carnithine racemase [Neobacillus niacini]|uniref:enoyl-CoA hydratase/isomerase family protein n=1 Tax=Neobacillus niacini TaxID=86668 RepID=UPI00285DB413|nr:enoyl-CoA hydratase/isomerase family protein [Neobacillus niacini]MDR7079784.1 enoyl-CoA hydratase/carnithine racemase [Neobacillus niacini]
MASTRTIKGAFYLCTTLNISFIPLKTITINRPKFLNALNSEVLKELTELADAIGSNPSIRAVILSSAGEKAFVIHFHIERRGGKSDEFSYRISR